MQEDSYKDKAVSGAIWKLLERFSNYGVTFVVGIILARILSPDDYGIIGMLTVFFSLAIVLQDSGFGTALTQKKDCTQSDYSTVFIFNLMTSLLLYVCLYISAPAISVFYNTPLLVDIIRVSGLSIIITGLTGVQYTKLNIDLKFSTRSKLSIAGTLISGIVGITMAYCGFGVWALVFQGLVSAAIIGAVLWIIAGWRPSFVFSKESFLSLFKFGGNMLGSGLINCIYGNLYTVVIGRCFSPYHVGMYNRADGYASLPANVLSDISMSVNFPILSKLQDDNDRLLNAYEKLLKIPFFFLFPFLTLIIVLAEPIIMLMIGEKWMPCVPYLQILCVGYMFYPLNGFNMNLLYVKGRSDLALKMELIKKPVGLSFLFCSLPFGITWIMLGKALYSVIVYAMNCYYTNKILDYGFSNQLRILLPIILYSFITGVSVMLVITLFSSPVVKLVIGLLSAVIIYVSINLLFKNKILEEVTDIIKYYVCRNR